MRIESATALRYNPTDPGQARGGAAARVHQDDSVVQRNNQINVQLDNLRGTPERVEAGIVVYTFDRPPPAWRDPDVQVQKSVERAERRARAEAAKTEARSDAAPKTDTAKSDVAKVDIRNAAAPKAEVANAEVRKAAAPKTEAPTQDQPQPRADNAPETRGNVVSITA